MPTCLIYPDLEMQDTFLYRVKLCTYWIFLYFIYGHKVVIGRCRYFKSVSTVSVFRYTGRYFFKKSVRYFAVGVEATATATTSRRRGCRSVIDGRRRIKRGDAGRRDELCRCSKRTCTHDALKPWLQLK